MFLGGRGRPRSAAGARRGPDARSGRGPALRAGRRAAAAAGAVAGDPRSGRGGSGSDPRTAAAGAGRASDAAALRRAVARRRQAGRLRRAAGGLRRVAVTNGAGRSSRAGRTSELGAHVPPAEIDELRIVSTYLASHPELPVLALAPPPGDATVRRFVAQATDSLVARRADSRGAQRAGSLRAQEKGSSTTSAPTIGAERHERPDRRLTANQRERDRAEAGGDRRRS